MKSVISRSSSIVQPIIDLTVLGRGTPIRQIDVGRPNVNLTNWTILWPHTLNVRPTNVRLVCD